MIGLLLHVVTFMPLAYSQTVADYMEWDRERRRPIVIWMVYPPGVEEDKDKDKGADGDEPEEKKPPQQKPQPKDPDDDDDDCDEVPIA